MPENNKKKQEYSIHPDNAKLSGDSAFYQPENKKTTREKLSEMDAKGKAAFITEYYGLVIVLSLAAVGFLVFLVCHFLFGRDIAFNVMAVNTPQEACPADGEEFYNDFLTENGVDLKKGKVSVTSGLGVSEKGDDSASETNLNTIQMRLMACSVDVFLSNEEVLYSLGEFEYLADLRECLPEKVAEKYKDDFVYAKIIEIGETFAVGIRLSADNEWLQSTGWYPDGTVIGIAAGAPNAELAEAYLLEVMGEN